MQSTGQTSTQASQPVQLSARTTASSFGSFLRAFPAPFAIGCALAESVCLARAGQAARRYPIINRPAPGGQRRLEERRPLVQAGHAVEVLDRHTAGAADQVVLAGQDDDPAADDARRYIQEVRPGTVLG